MRTAKTVRVCKSSKACSDCSGPIESGDRYTEWTAFPDRREDTGWFRIALCASCRTIREPELLCGCPGGIGLHYPSVEPDCANREPA